MSSWSLPSCSLVFNLLGFGFSSHSVESLTNSLAKSESQAFFLSSLLSLRVSFFSDPMWLTAAAVFGKDPVNSAGTCLTCMELQEKQLLKSEPELCVNNLLAL